jgi:hypothetical protein
MRAALDGQVLPKEMIAVDRPVPENEVVSVVVQQIAPAAGFHHDQI